MKPNHPRHPQQQQQQQQQYSQQPTLHTFLQSRLPGPSSYPSSLTASTAVINLLTPIKPAQAMTTATHELKEEEADENEDERISNLFTPPLNMGTSPTVHSLSNFTKRITTSIHNTRKPTTMTTRASIPSTTTTFSCMMPISSSIWNRKKNQSRFQSCPLCFKSFPIHMIETHASTCIVVGCTNNNTTRTNTYSIKNDNNREENIEIHHQEEEEQQQQKEDKTNQDSIHHHHYYYSKKIIHFFSYVWKDMKCLTCQNILFQTHLIHPCGHLLCQSCILNGCNNCNNNYNNNHNPLFLPTWTTTKEEDEGDSTSTLLCDNNNNNTLSTCPICQVKINTITRFHSYDNVMENIFLILQQHFNNKDKQEDDDDDDDDENCIKNRIVLDDPRIQQDINTFLQRQEQQVKQGDDNKNYKHRGNNSPINTMEESDYLQYQILNSSYEKKNEIRSSSNRNVSSSSSSSSVCKRPSSTLITPMDGTYRQRDIGTNDETDLITTSRYMENSPFAKEQEGEEQNHPEEEEDDVSTVYSVEEQIPTKSTTHRTSATTTTSSTKRNTSMLVWKRMKTFTSTLSSSTIPVSPSMKRSPDIPWTQPLPGLFIFEDFITPIEEMEILQYLDSETNIPWKHSNFNGPYLGKRWGVLCNLRDRKVCEAETSLPHFFTQILFPKLYALLWLENQLPTHLCTMIREYHPNEANAIRYYKKKGHSLANHCDDRQLSKEIIANLSLEGDCYMLYKNEKWKKENNRNSHKMGYKIQQPGGGDLSTLAMDTKAKVGGGGVEEEQKKKSTAEIFIVPGRKSEGVPFIQIPSYEKVYLKRRTLQLLTGRARYDYSHGILNEDFIHDTRVSITMRESPVMK